MIETGGGVDDRWAGLYRPVGGSDVVRSCPSRPTDVTVDWGTFPVKRNCFLLVPFLGNSHVFAVFFPLTDFTVLHVVHT